MGGLPICTEIAQFLTPANYGTLIGNFELDFKDGEIRYKTSIDVEGDRLTPALIKRLVYSTLATNAESTNVSGYVVVSYRSGQFHQSELAAWLASIANAGQQNIGD